MGDTSIDTFQFKTCAIEIKLTGMIFATPREEMSHPVGTATGSFLTFPESDFAPWPKTARAAGSSPEESPRRDCFLLVALDIIRLIAFHSLLKQADF